MNNWTKIGKIFDVCDYSSKYNYSAVPFVKDLGGNNVEVFFSSRDENNRSVLMSMVYDILNGNVLSCSLEPHLYPGALGLFDDSGVMGTDYLNVDGDEFIYYIGWNLGVTVPFRNSLGVANYKQGKWSKMYLGPILDRNKDEPHFNASSCVIFDEGIYKIWYLSCVKWEVVNEEVRHHYHIKYATSDNGIDWNREGIVAIDFESKFEYAISVPRVLKIDGEYHMWFSSRATEKCDKYTIRYASSKDGITWLRTPEPVLFSGKESWEDTMVCYPYILKRDDKLYMFYNGNSYGKSGIGLAVSHIE